VTVAVVFPGQGSQAPGAGQAWIDHPAWAVVDRAEAALGTPLAPLLLDPDADLSRTRESQLSVLLLSLVAWEATRTEITEPIAFAGHSLGQITALIAAGAVAIDDGVALAAARAEETQRAADANPGGLAALLGATEDQAREACAAGDAWIANLNAPGQVVIGGTPAGLDAAADAATRLGVRRVRRLAVGGAFHTPLMAPAADALHPRFENTDFRSTDVPVVANHDATPYTEGDGWAERLHRHLVEPVRWLASVEALVSAGAETVLEVGPGTTLTSLVARIAPDVATANVAGPADVGVVAA